MAVDFSLKSTHWQVGWRIRTVRPPFSLRFSVPWGDVCCHGSAGRSAGGQGVPRWFEDQDQWRHAKNILQLFGELLGALKFQCLCPFNVEEYAGLDGQTSWRYIAGFPVSRYPLAIAHGLRTCLNMSTQLMAAFRRSRAYASFLKTTRGSSFDCPALVLQAGRPMAETQNEQQFPILWATNIKDHKSGSKWKIHQYPHISTISIHFTCLFNKKTMVVFHLEDVGAKIAPGATVRLYLEKYEPPTGDLTQHQFEVGG